jgi:inner membrane transporter RhtA
VLGPLTLSVLAARWAVSWLWALLALAGVALLGWGDLNRLNLVGVLLCLVAGALWAGCILLSARTGGRFPKADGLALALAVAALLSLPVGIANAGAALLDPTTLGLGAAVAALSTMVPYTMELSALRRLPTATFALLMSLGPAIAALAGFLILGQALTGPQGWAIALVVIASADAVHAGRGSAPATAFGHRLVHCGRSAERHPEVGRRHRQHRSAAGHIAQRATRRHRPL